MTEFELQQLDYMETERIQGLLGLIQSQAELIANDATMMSTLLFGYLVVAYFVGGHLTKVQAAIFSTLYVAAFLANSFSATNSALVAVGFQARYVELSGATGSPSLTPIFMFLGAMLNLSMLLGSLYFMWSVRHPKTE
ncbi:MAG: hypothetical protein V7709_16440 [Halioglobus sp.]